MSIRHLHLLRRTSFVLCLSLLLVCCLVLPCFASDDSRVSDVSRQEVSVESLRIGPSDTSGFHAVVLGLLGDYNPIVKDYTYTTTSYNGTTTTNHSIEIEPDWSWIATAAIFLVIIFCLFRLIGGLFACKR